MKASTSRTVSAKVLHSIVSVLLVFAMIFVFSACQSDAIDPNETVNIGGGSEGERTAPAQTADLSRLVRISLTIDATRAYNNASLPQNIKDGLQNEGMLITNAMLTLSEGKTVAETFSLLRTYDIVIVSESGAAGTFVTSIQGLENGACGAASGWLFRVNGEFPSEGIDSIELHNGDKVEWLFSCDGGTDVACLSLNNKINADCSCPCRIKCCGLVCLLRGKPNLPPFPKKIPHTYSLCRSVIARVLFC